MNAHIKKFIEENIRDIENEDWYGVFFSWYLHWGTFDLRRDRELLSELFDVLKEAFDNVMFDSLDARMIIIQDSMEEYINARASNPNANNISFTAIADVLNSRLHLEADTLLKIFKDAAKSCGFVVSNDLNIHLRDD